MTDPAATPPGTPPLSLDDYATLARHELPSDIWDFIAGGAGRERTLAANEAAFDTVCLRPKALPGFTEPDTHIRVLGARWAAPLGVAPVAYHELAHGDGETGTARAAGGLGLPLVVSTFASQSLERVARDASAPLWLQMYCFRDEEVARSLAGRAAAAGYEALVVTVDTPFVGRRLRDLRNGFQVPPHIVPANLVEGLAEGARADDAASPAAHSRTAFHPALDWSVVARLREWSGLPVLAKGVLSGEDAWAALDAGVAGIIVSNHGGRQLDGAPATLEVLPEVVAAVGGRCPVLMDGGVRHGSDIVVALAFGATAVLVGRPVLHGLAVDGTAGVHAVLSLLMRELADTMALTGRATVDAVDVSVLAPRAMHLRHLDLPYRPKEQR